MHIFHPKKEKEREREKSKIYYSTWNYFFSWNDSSFHKKKCSVCAFFIKQTCFFSSTCVLQLESREKGDDEEVEESKNNVNTRQKVIVYVSGEVFLLLLFFYSPFLVFVLVNKKHIRLEENEAKRRYIKLLFYFSFNM